jgi:ribokinase
VTVVVVGSVNLDIAAIGGRIPRPGETVTMGRLLESHGGKGANQAAAAALGACVHFIGMVGADPRGAAARSDLAARGVNIDGLGDSREPTGVAMVLVDDGGENAIAIVAGANAALTAEHVEEALGRLRSAHPVVVVACLEIPLAAVQAAARLAEAAGWRFVLNPAPAAELPETLIRRCSVITPNATEARLLGGPEALLGKGAGAVVITRGRDGASLHLPDLEPRELPAVAAAVRDTTGAGDAFTAGIAVALANGRPLADAVAWDNAVGAVATEGVGARGSLATAAEATQRLAAMSGASPVQP